MLTFVFPTCPSRVFRARGANCLRDSRKFALRALAPFPDGEFAPRHRSIQINATLALKFETRDYRTRISSRFPTRVNTAREYRNRFRFSLPRVTSLSLTEF